MQNQNRIQNPQPPGSNPQKGPQMNDRDRLNDILATEKHLTEGFNTAALESSHEQLYRTMMTILNETHQGARDVYNVMFRLGEYALEAAQQQKLDETKQQFQGYGDQFSYANANQVQ